MATFLAAGLSIDSQATPNGPTPKELDAIELADHGNITHPAQPQPPGRIHTSSEAMTGFEAPSELERSEPSTPKQNTATSVVPTLWFPAMNKWRVLAASFEYFGNGMSDSAPGALLPYIEDYYNIGYAIVSLIWITNAVGFILSAFFNDAIQAKLGRAKSLMLSEMMMTAAFVIIACAPPFPVVVVAYCLLGFGNALNLALNNVFCSNLADSTVVLGIANGCYGIGGIIAPIAATSMVSNNIFWARFYIIPIAVRAMCFFLVGWTFRGYEKESSSLLADPLHQVTKNDGTTNQAGASGVKVVLRALKNRTTMLGALFIFTYQGAEVATSGWFISYLITYRKGNPSNVGYVTAGFWAGITVGRFVLTHVAYRVGEKRFVFVMGCGVIAFQIMAWQIPNVIGDAVAVSILGLLLGPLYPCAQTIFSRLLPKIMHVFTLGFISSAGSSGGAVVPFITGLIAQSVGTWVLHPICIASYAIMLVSWVLLPRMRKMAAE